MVSNPKCSSPFVSVLQVSLLKMDIKIEKFSKQICFIITVCNGKMHMIIVMKVVFVIENTCIWNVAKVSES